MDDEYHKIFEEAMKRVDKLMVDQEKKMKSLEGQIKYTERYINLDEQEAEELERPCDCGPGEEVHPS